MNFWGKNFHQNLYFLRSKLPFWSLWFGHFCHFSPNLKLFKSGSLWFHFCCHFSPKFKLPPVSLLKAGSFVFLFRGIIVHFFITVKSLN
ncbi:hypothetical protein Hanom_Chr14g01287411 [Helianthus anomalus]